MLRTTPRTLDASVHKHYRKGHEAADFVLFHVAFDEVIELLLGDSPGVAHLESLQLPPADIVQQRSSGYLKDVEEFTKSVDSLTFLFVVYFHHIPSESFR